MVEQTSLPPKIQFDKAFGGGYRTDEVDRYVDQVVREHEAFQQEILALTDERDRLQNELTALKVRSDNVRQMFDAQQAKLNGEVQQLRRQLEEARRADPGQDEALARLEHEATALRAEVSALRNQLEEARRTRVDLAVLDEAQAERDELEAEVESLKEELSSLRGRPDPEEMMLVKAERDDLQTHVLSLEQELKNAEAERNSYQELAEKFAASEAQARDVLRAAARAADEVRIAAQREADETVRLAQARARRTEDEARRRLERLEADFNKLREEYDQFVAGVRRSAASFLKLADERD
jgi:DivIVA domain-containing protein